MPDHLHEHHTNRALLAKVGPVSPEEMGWEYGIGGYQPPAKISYYLNDPVIVACDWIGFLCLFAASVVLMYKLFSFKGPDGDSDFFIGYREQKCISIYVNLIAALTYWGRVAAHMNGDVGLGLSVNFYKYFDYIFTCPILVIFLLGVPYASLQRRTRHCPSRRLAAAELACCPYWRAPVQPPDEHVLSFCVCADPRSPVESQPAVQGHIRHLRGPDDCLWRVLQCI